MSPCIVNILTPLGLEIAPFSADSLADAVQYEPHDGVYTLANTFNHDKVLKIDAHLDRLEDSARRIGISITIDRTALRMALREMIDQSGYDNVRYRITIPQATPDRIILSIEPFKGHPPEIYTDGVKCITLPNVARSNPIAKTTGWMHDRDSVTLPPDIFTGLLVNDNDDILEGTSSNFYAILDGELRTAVDGVLPGIAQKIIFEIAPDVLPVKREAVNVRDIPLLTEAFISGSSRGIVPVVEIDNVTLSDGRPGMTTQKLQTVYSEWMKTHLEDL